jgi:hypothetical protein
MDNCNQKSWQPIWGCVDGAKRRRGDGQDAANALGANGLYIAAVADGISGAGELAGYGAELAVEVVQAYLKESFAKLWELPPERLMGVFLREFLQRFSVRVNQFSIEHNLPPVIDGEQVTDQLESFGTTLLAVVIQNNKLLLFKVGNGSVSYGYGDSYHVLLPSEVTANSETPDITLPIHMLEEYAVVDRYYIPDELCSLVLMSDGVEFSGGLYEPYGLTSRFVEEMQKVTTGGRDALEGLLHDLARQNPVGDDVSCALLFRGGSGVRIGGDNPMERYRLYLKNPIEARNTASFVRPYKGREPLGKPLVLDNATASLVASEPHEAKSQPLPPEPVQAIDIADMMREYGDSEKKKKPWSIITLVAFLVCAVFVLGICLYQNSRELSVANAEIAQKSDENNQLTDDYESITQELKQVTAELQDSEVNQQKLNETQGQLKAAQQEMEQLKKDLADKESENQSLQQKNGELATANNRLNNRIAELEAAAEKPPETIPEAPPATTEPETTPEETPAPETGNTESTETIPEETSASETGGAETP